MEKKLVERFKARGTSGTIYEVVHRKEMIDVTNHSSQSPEHLDGLDFFNLSDGSALNVIGESDDTFQIVRTGEIIRRIV